MRVDEARHQDLAGDIDDRGVPGHLHLRAGPCRANPIAFDDDDRVVDRRRSSAVDEPCADNRDWERRRRGARRLSDDQETEDTEATE